MHSCTSFSKSSPVHELFLSGWVHTCAITDIACNSHCIAVQITCDICAMQIQPYKQMAEIALHLQQNGAGPSFWFGLHWNRIAWVFTPMQSDSCTISWFALRSVNRSRGVTNFTMTPAPVHRCQCEPPGIQVRCGNRHRNHACSRIAQV